VSSIVPLRDGGELAPFEPAKTCDKQAKLDALIDYARKVKDWPLLGEAVDAKIEDQTEYLGWWDEKVGIRESPGRGGVKSNAERGSIPKDIAERDTGISQQQVSRWRKSLADTEKYRARLILAAYRKADLEPAEHHLAKGTGDNEWFTPIEYVEAAREVMGGIDLDPATHPQAQQIIAARRFYTREDDGLAQSWQGRVWLNPPYAQPLIERFVQKLVQEYTQGDVAQAVLLTNNSTDTAWFHAAAAVASSFCFTRGRIQFLDPDGDKCEAPLQGQVFCYFGPYAPRFADIFGKFGIILHA
jgi:phage N-6-adenine-methyltransferase